MIRFTDYRKAKIISEAATQEQKLKMRRPTPMFPNGKKIKLDPPPKLSSDETKAELKEVREMMAAVENMDELRKLDISFDDMMKAALQDVGATDADMKHIDEMQRQIDTLTLTQKYNFNRPRPKETAKFYGEELTEHAVVRTPAYPSNHAIRGYVIAAIMGKKYPEAQQLLDMIAEKNAISRIELGVHFMSDIKAGREMADKMIDMYTEPVVTEAKLKFQGKEMKDHLDKAKAKLTDKYGSLDNVDYKKAMKVVGATLAARLAARGMIKRSSGKKEKGELGKK